MAGIPIRNGNRHGGPGSREEGVGLARPLGADAQAPGRRGARPPAAPSRPGHLHRAQGAHRALPRGPPGALPPRRAVAPGPGCQCSAGAGVEAPAGSQPQQSRGEQGRAGLASPAPASAAAAALARARSGSGLFIHPFTLPPQASLRLAPPSLTSPPRLPAGPAPLLPGKSWSAQLGRPSPPGAGWGRNYYLGVLTPSLSLPRPPRGPPAISHHCHLWL